MPGIEPGSHPPQGRVLPLYYIPKNPKLYFFDPLKIFLHLAQTKILFPEERVNH